jgi:hypothetical protein
MHVGGIFCGLAKAFNCVNHVILLSQLHYFGIRGTMANWFRSYLTERKQKIEIKSPYATRSIYLSWGAIKHGVPQGSILEPLLFIIYIIFFLSLFIKNSNLVYTNKTFVSNLICYCEFTKYLFYNNHFGSDNIGALP